MRILMKSGACALLLMTGCGVVGQALYRRAYDNGVDSVGSEASYHDHLKSHEMYEQYGAKPGTDY